MTRQAIDTIAGYFYQFDKTILEILSLKNLDDAVCVEGIEDIDVEDSNSVTAVQCKYHSGTSYTHSKIKEPIRLMAKYYSENKTHNLKYHLFACFKDSQDSFPSLLTVDFVKQKFLTHTERKTKKNPTPRVIKYYDEYGLSNDDIKSFIKKLSVDLHAPSLEDQYAEIIKKIGFVLSVSPEEAELYHYNAALKKVRNLSIEKLEDNRKVTKKVFLEEIKVQDQLFDSWFIKRKGYKKYLTLIRKEKLSRKINTENNERFFLLDCTDLQNFAQLPRAVTNFAKNWSKTLKRTSSNYCPTFYFHKLSSEKLIAMKRYLHDNKRFFQDGYPFQDSFFDSEYFFKKPTKQNKIKFRILNSLDDLEIALEKAPTISEIYQIYTTSPFYDNDLSEQIKLHDILDIKELAS